MAEIKTLFVTKLYRAELEGAKALNADLLRACRAIAADPYSQLASLSALFDAFRDTCKESITSRAASL